MLTRRVVQGLAFVFILASLPIFAIRRPDIPTSQNGIAGNCGQGSPCPFVGYEDTASLSGTDATGNAVTVTINLYNFGYYPCPDTCQPSPVIQSAVLDVILRGPATDTVGIESFVVKGVLPNPAYVSCGGIEVVYSGNLGIGCVFSPEPNGFYVQEPTPVAAADGTNTRWDFVGFDQILCAPVGDAVYLGAVCQQSPFGAPNQPLGEAILAVSNSVAQNHLGTTNSGYLVTLTDGTRLGTLAIPASPTKQVATTNNMQATATVITGTSFKDYTDTSQSYPQMNSDGTEYNPPGFIPLPTSNPPPCNPTNDNRTFRTAWYSYTAPSDGSVTISTAGSRYDTLIYVFTGSASAPTTISCNDDPFPSNGFQLLQAVTSFNVTQGTNYQIVVGETPPVPVGYPLSTDGTLYFSSQFSTKAVSTKTATETTITSSLNPAYLNQSVTLSATVTANGPGTPTGTVTFKGGSTKLGAATLSGGTAALTTTTLPLGITSITVVYNGDANFSASNSSALWQTVQASSTTTLTSSANPSNFAAPVTFTTTVTSPGGTPTGSVSIYNPAGGITLGVSALVSGVAKFTTSKLIGSNDIFAIYNGSPNILGSTSNSITQLVGLAPHLRILHSFAGGTDGDYPVAGLVEDSHGNLYGTTQNGGASRGGTVFKVVAATGEETVLYSFTGTGGDGASPEAGVVLDKTGNLYGTTYGGGTSGNGTVFKIDTSGNEAILYTFSGTSGDGANPEAGLVLDSAGNLYGTTLFGGDLACSIVLYVDKSGCGTVFKLDSTGKETVLYTFTGTDGAFPGAGLVLDADGNLYGTTEYGGDLTCGPDGSGCGTVFEVTGPSQEKVLYSFTGTGGDGAVPSAGLLLDAQGDFFGTTFSGGTGHGTVFKMTTTGTESVLYSFTGTGGDGANPLGDLVQDAQGNLYGTTQSGGEAFYRYGVVFKVSGTGKESIVYTFVGVEGDGANPQGRLVLNPALGALYGTTSSGGSNDNSGIVFEIPK